MGTYFRVNFKAIFEYINMPYVSPEDLNKFWYILAKLYIFMCQKIGTADNLGLRVGGNSMSHNFFLPTVSYVFCCCINRFRWMSSVFPVDFIPFLSLVIKLLSYVCKKRGPALNCRWIKSTTKQLNCYWNCSWRLSDFFILCSFCFKYDSKVNAHFCMALE